MNKKKRGSGRQGRQKNDAFPPGGSGSADWRNYRDFPKNNVNESNHFRYNDERSITLFSMLIGLNIKITTTDESTYEGILETISPDLEFHVSHSFYKNKKGFVNSQKGKVDDLAVFQFCDIVHCKAVDVDFDFAKRKELLTDGAISGSNGLLTERELKRYTFDDNEQHVALEDESISSTTPWGFEVMIRTNEEKHGVKSNYDETMSTYMTPIDKHNDKFKAQEIRAEQLVKQMNDERSLELDAIDSGVDEEERFSSVSRTADANNEFVSYTSKAYRQKNGKSNGNAVAPRFQRNSRNQDVNQSVGNHGNNRVPLRPHNGRPVNTSNNQSPTNQQQQFHDNQFVQTRNNITITSPLRQQDIQQSKQQTTPQATMNYSAAMKKPTAGVNKVVQSVQNTPAQQPTGLQQVVPSVQNTPPQQPTGLQQVAQSVQNTPPQQPTGLQHISSPQISVHLQSVGLPNQEALNAAKKQVIQDLQKGGSKNYALIAQTGLPNHSPATTTYGQVSSFTTTTVSSTSSQSLTTSGARSVESAVEGPQCSALQREKKEIISSEQKKDSKMLLNKFGKVHQSVPEDEKKPSASVNDLLHFSNAFMLDPQKKISEGGVKDKPTNDQKTVEIRTCSPILSKEITAVPTTTTEVISPLTSTVTEQSPTKNFTHSKETAHSDVKKTSLNPAAKEFVFNPVAKEFTPKSEVVKPMNHVNTPEMFPVVHHAVYTGYQNASMVTHQHPTDTMPKQIQQIPQYSQPMSNYNQNSHAVAFAGHSSNLMPHAIQQPHLFVVQNNPYQSVVPGQPNQQYILQSNAMPYVNQAHRYQSNYQDGSQNYQFIAVSQPNTYPVPSLSPSVMQQQPPLASQLPQQQQQQLPQQYVISYSQPIHQHRAQAPYTPVSSQHYLPQQQQQQQQQSYVMLSQQQQQHAHYNPAHQYHQGQQYPGVIQNYQPTN